MDDVPLMWRAPQHRVNQTLQTNLKFHLTSLSYSYGSLFPPECQKLEKLKTWNIKKNMTYKVPIISYKIAILNI